MGWKIAAGAIHARDAGATYIMPTDVDDLISNRVPAFPAAVYRTAHSESNYQRGSLLTEIFSRRQFRRKGLRVLKQLWWIRPFGKRGCGEFHGGAAVE